MSEHDAVALAERFARYRSEVLTEVEPPGPAAVRRVVRQRRRRTLGTAVAAVLALGTGPIFGYAALTDPGPRPGPVDPTGSPSASPSATGSASPSASPEPTSASPTRAPDGRISRAQLLAAPVSLPGWRPGPSCPVTDVRLAGDPVRDGTNVLEGLAHGDVDGDGATETVALVHCLLGTGGPAQVVAFDRDPAGRVVTLGRVVATARETPQWLTGVEVRPDGLVRVQVADLAPGGGWPGEWSQRQWRGYRWNGERFGQTEGPTSFGPNPYSANLAISVAELRLTEADDGSRVGWIEARIRHLGGREVTAVQLRLELPAQLEPDVDGWGGCGADVADRTPLVCRFGSLEPGGELPLRLAVRVRPGVALPAGTAPLSVAALGPGSNFLLERDDSDNQDTIVWR